MSRPVRLLSMLFVLAAGAACGGEANSAASDPSEPPGAFPVQVPPRTEVPPTPLTILPGVGAPLPPATDALPRETDEAETVLGIIYAILERNCGACHQANSGMARSSLEFTDDIDLMVELGIIIPLQSGRSPLVQLMQSGAMPPSGVEPRPEPNDILAVAQFIDNPRFWPMFSAMGLGAAAGEGEAAGDAGAAPAF